MSQIIDSNKTNKEFIYVKNENKDENIENKDENIENKNLDNKKKKNN